MSDQKRDSISKGTKSTSWLKKAASVFESKASRRYNDVVQPHNEPELVNGKKMVRYSPAHTQAYGSYFAAKGGRF
ncbi:hypothetical protein GQ53DRAFT_81563 [Thozetella sp. PMI_491]|nr:hypothetical protein GQ53DRAFT_81563 [Thozetella sp. PMI_491]